MSTPYGMRRRTLLSGLLYEFRKGKSEWETFKNLCEGMGEDASFDYREFDYWFMRFANKKFDISRESSRKRSKLELGDLPPEIVKEIIKKTTWRDIIALRQVSQSMRATVDQLNLIYPCGEILVERSATSVRFGPHTENFFYSAVEKCEKFEESMNSEASKESQLEQNFKRTHREVLQNLKALSMHPRVSIGSLRINTGPHVDVDDVWMDPFFEKPAENWQSFQDPLLAKRCSLRVKTAEIGSNFLLTASFLASMDFDFLENLTISGTAINMEHFQLTSFKNARNLNYSGNINTWRPNNIVNFEQILFEVGFIDMPEALQFKNEALESTRMKKWRIYWKDQEDGLEEDELNEFEHFLGGNLVRKQSEFENPRIYEFEGQNGVKIEMRLGYQFIEVEKI